MFTSAGIIIPVMIHLWNRRQGKTLKVGSIALLTQSYQQQAKSVQLQEPLLLLLRCLLILLVAVVLSHPVWEAETNSAKQKGWILMEKQGLQQTYARFKPAIDSLLLQQYQFHYFDKGFESDNLERALKIKDTLIQNSSSYWSLLSALDQQVPATLPVYLFTANSLNRFAGSRPQVAMNLQWYTYTSKDSVSEWLAKAYITTADSIRLVSAASSPSGTVYHYENVAAAPQKTAEYSIQANNNTISVSYQNEQAVTVDTATLTITIFTDKYSNDASYIKAALEAIRQYSKRKIKLSLVHNSADIPHHQDWVFWLSDLPVSAIGGRNIFVYEKGKTELIHSSIQTDNNGNDEEQVTLYKRIPYEAVPSKLLKTIWQDGFGNPLLELEKTSVPVYHFFSHFDPSWSGLPWSNAFPRMIFNIIFSTENNSPVSDRRILDEQQLQPILTTAGKAVVKGNLVITQDLSQAFWLAALVVFFMERYISFKTKMEKTNA